MNQELEQRISEVVKERDEAIDQKKRYDDESENLDKLVSEAREHIETFKSLLN